jgi:hypothetical protein
MRMRRSRCCFPPHHCELLQRHLPLPDYTAKVAEKINSDPNYTEIIIVFGLTDLIEAAADRASQQSRDRRFEQTRC